MGKSSKSLFIGALASTLLSGVAFSADYIPAPVIDFEPEYEVEVGGNFYLRGYIGFTNQSVDRLDTSAIATPAEQEFLHSRFEAGGLFGGAIGYQANEWFRGDISAEYRMRTAYDGLDRYDTVDVDATWDGTNDYDADKSEIIVLANAFVDMGTYYNITPYVGAGAGVSYTMIDDMTDVNVPTNGVAYASGNGEWSFAWALYAGVGFEVNDRVTLDLGYRYLSIGDAESGDLIPFTGPNTPDTPIGFEGISSHDVTFGFRYALGPVGGSGHGTGYGGGSSTGMLSY